ncbi:unnamed protein product, partial [Prorocentrum cordatum]
MLFTLCLSFGVLCVGALQWLSSGMYAFEPFAMLGGTLWAIGNLCVPFIIQHCGLGIGQLVWSVTNMLTGWASGTFGILGKEKDFVAHPSLNFAGVAMAIMSLGLFKFIKDTSSDNSEKVGLISGASSQSARGFGGWDFNPPTYLQQIGQRDRIAGLIPRHSPYATDYVISHFSGIFATTAAAFAVYAVATKGRVYLGREVVLPGILAGALWGIAQVAWFKANGVLSYVVAFPIIVGVPGLIAALWGVVLFGENRGKHNLSVLGLVVAVQAVAVSLIQKEPKGWHEQRNHTTFHANLSSTYSAVASEGPPLDRAAAAAAAARGRSPDSVTITFGTGQVSGHFARDAVCLGFMCADMNFISATNESDEPFKDVPFDGILGLALPRLSEEQGFSLVDALVKDGLLRRGLFSVFFADEESDEESEVLFGDLREEHMAGPLSWVPVANPGFWQVAMQDIAFNGESINICGSGCQAALDTGTSLLAGPARLVRLLVDRLRVAADCSNFDSLPDLGFIIGGQVLSLKPGEYVDRSEEGCVLGLMALDIPAPRGGPPLFILGDPFLR